MIRLMKKHILLMHDQLVKVTGGSNGLRDERMLDSAIETIYQTFDGEELYPSVKEKTARLCFGLVKNHAFVDGNKRIGAHAMLVFLALNGYEMDYSQEELYTVILKVADGSCSYEELQHWIMEHRL